MKTIKKSIYCRVSKPSNLKGKLFASLPPSMYIFEGIRNRKQCVESKNIFGLFDMWAALLKADADYI